MNTRQSMAKASWLYHAENMTQAQIAERLNPTRRPVNELLAAALDEGVTRISFHSSFAENGELEARLREAFDLGEAVAAPSPADPRQLHAAPAFRCTNSWTGAGFPIEAGFLAGARPIARPWRARWRPWISVRWPNGRWKACRGASASGPSSPWPWRNEPGILLLDEPTSFLDLRHAAKTKQLNIAPPQFLRAPLQRASLGSDFSARPGPTPV